MQIDRAFHVRSWHWLHDLCLDLVAVTGGHAWIAGYGGIFGVEKAQNKVPPICPGGGVVGRFFCFGNAAVAVSE